MEQNVSQKTAKRLGEPAITYKNPTYPRVTTNQKNIYYTSYRAETNPCDGVLSNYDSMQILKKVGAAIFYMELLRAPILGTNRFLILHSLYKAIPKSKTCQHRLDHEQHLKKTKTKNEIHHICSNIIDSSPDVNAILALCHS